MAGFRENRIPIMELLPLPYLPGANVKAKQSSVVCYFACSSNPGLAYGYITFIIYGFIQVDLLSSRSVKVIVVAIKYFNSQQLK